VYLRGAQNMIIQELSSFKDPLFKALNKMKNQNQQIQSQSKKLIQIWIG